MSRRRRCIRRWRHRASVHKTVATTQKRQSMRILCRVPLVARNWARRKSETIMYIEMSLPPGKRRVIESTVYHLHPYISTVIFFLIICSNRRKDTQAVRNRERTCKHTQWETTYVTMTGDRTCKQHNGDNRRKDVQSTKQRKQGKGRASIPKWKQRRRI